MDWALNSKTQTSENWGYCCIYSMGMGGSNGYRKVVNTQWKVRGVWGFALLQPCAAMAVFPGMGGVKPDLKII